MIKNNIIINNNKISYILNSKSVKGPKASVVFLCGYKSDKNGAKALFIEDLRKKVGFEYLRFDYSGHGDSSGKIDDLLISDWIQESSKIIKDLTNFPIILIGSSMGGWIAFYLASIINKKILGVIGIATAVDFTFFLERELDEKQKKKFIKTKQLVIRSNYSDKPYIFKKKFIQDSKKFFLLNKRTKINCKSILLYGLRDNSVKLDSQLQLLNIFNNNSVSLIVLPNSDHRMSTKNDLKILKEIILDFIKTH